MRSDPRGLIVRWCHVLVTKRTTVEIDPELLEQAREVLGETTTQGTVEEALRRVAGKTSIKGSPSAANQRRYLQSLHSGLGASDTEGVVDGSRGCGAPRRSNVLAEPRTPGKVVPSNVTLEG
jgi:Arc/MetJ family transcription regulator